MGVPSSPRTVSMGRLTTIFLLLGGFTGDGSGSGLSLRPGPPNGAFGGPLMLRLGALLFLGMKGCPKGGGMIWGGKTCPNGVIGNALGPGKLG